MQQQEEEEEEQRAGSPTWPRETVRRLLNVLGEGAGAVHGFAVLTDRTALAVVAKAVQCGTSVVAAWFARRARD